MLYTYDWLELLYPDSVFFNCLVVYFLQQRCDLSIENDE